MASTSSHATFTIGAGAGFAGDRIEPAVSMAQSGEVDAIALECLGERTLVDPLTISGLADGGSVRSERRGLVESITGFLPRDSVATTIEWASWA